MAFRNELYGRRWITREEIAEIYDALAAKKRQALRDGVNADLDIFQLAPLAAQAGELQDRADDIRATDSQFTSPVGDRVA